MNRAYSVLHVKAANPDLRVITGVASTPTPDRLGDIVEPLGMSFKNPVPLLLYHDTKKPVGTVKFFPPTKDGLEFEASLPTIDEPGTLHDRVEEAWQSIKAGLLAAVSIGFRAIEEAWMNDAAAYRFIKTEVLELSLVTIPANQDATIETIKRLDQVHLPPGATGTVHRPGASGTPVVRVQRGATAMTIPDQIKSYEATRAADVARQAALMQTAADAGTTLDAAQGEEYDTLGAKVKAVDAHLVRLHEQEQLNIARAVAVTGPADPNAAAAERRGVVIQLAPNLPKATGFTRYARALIMSRGNLMQAAEIAKQWRDSTPEVELALKAAVAVGTTTDAVWAGPLAPMKPLLTEFLELLRNASIVDRVPGMRHVPFNVSVAGQTGGGTYGWVGQNAPKPVSALAFNAQTLGIAKCSGIIVISEELARVSTPSAEDIIRRDMIAGIAAFLATQFTDPTLAPVANVSPGSITNGVALTASAGATPANARTDILTLAGKLVAANLTTAGAVLLMSETNALALAGALNPLGQPLYPGLNAQGGTVLGFQVITSQALGVNVILVQGNGILIADDGGVEIDVSREASVQMDSAPDNPMLATTVMQSLWQNNLVGLRADRFINWKRARLASVQYTQQTYLAA
jgi:HK97 family phage major capsid protein/HK97 family phage prohead protease